ncbi:hypothetical protein M422DRAFT_35700 [Sphaerobolus stellatus SS14]|uniref:F-box domain-containing protein n=1 Tax=Sphaerobolus stellatus (strain SS14) TaxID=990650 RepID=A0A0C9V5Q5_SPHS4|nr:hypothetical protein M422DRAFT_35700 [Sphaerobolus stellatus SS14]
MNSESMKTTIPEDDGQDPKSFLKPKNLRFPAEIVQGIFLLSAGGDMRTAVRISHVCGAWRTLARSCSPLWATITKDETNKSNNHEGTNKLDLLTMCLELSANADLDIRLIFGSSCRCDRCLAEDPPYKETLDLLLPYTSRITSLEVESEPEQLIYFLTRNPVWSPNLKLWIWQGNGRRDSSRFPWDSSVKPQLELARGLYRPQISTAIRKIGFAYAAPPAESSIWEGKDEIHLDQVPARSLVAYMDIMGRSPSLRIFRFRGKLSEERYATPGLFIPRPMENLQHLELLDMTLQGIIHIFETISFPNLQHLGVRPDLPEVEGETILSMMRRNPRSIAMCEAITSLTSTRSGLGRSGEIISATSADGKVTLFISIVLHNGFSDNITNGLYQLFPNVQEVSFQYGICWKETAAPHVEKVTLLSTPAINLKALIRDKLFPNVTQLVIQRGSISEYNAPIVDAFLSGSGERTLVFRDVYQVSESYAREKSNQIGTTFIWEKSEKS